MVCDPMYPHPPVTRIQGPLDIGDDDDDSEVIVVDLFALMVIVSCRYEWLMVVYYLFVVRSLND
jgi:hypothetical protein